MPFNEMLKKLRLSKGMTQDELSRATGLKRSALSMYESGNREPSFETLEMLADFFNVDLDTLLGRESKSTYYLDPETARLAQEAANDPDMRLLLDAKRDLSPEDMRIIVDLAKNLLKRNS